ncbi:TetR/AcrR family transcriptional regulator [Mycobacterium helveticum]|uniref:TetR/AcrR family transcriptional regulator n=1 Tax=Mycobacterium helveticum TaxID=2592811 RepID=A0A557XTT8_9MYCO|nr:TetR/AcrR family transcriptional regulator [Mycobacterium helveticum]TVS87636.1 TetR/AcrR family transcriptional regulator [Mycobacterium helveticum]TVS89402.1 TetR/AcrR family transcriptional regulator [Mycobacterium helveticum]
MLEAALTSLASGDPGSVSANRIAKEIGATWGAVQYQFGDTDGFWAAVLHRTAERRAATFSTLATTTQREVPQREVSQREVSQREVSLRERVGAIVETLYRGLASPDSRAIENLRAALPRDPRELERLYPRTAAELFSWGKSWLETCQNAFAGLGVDPERVREVATLIPGAMRGLVSERQLGSYADLDMARRGLTNALVAYLEQSRVE